MTKKSQPPTASSSQPAPNPAGPDSRQGDRPLPLIRTIIADDDVFGRKVLAQLLALTGGFDLVGTAADGIQAIRQAFELDPELVLMDHHMPHMDGIDATRYIKQLKNPPTVILVTSDNSPDCKARAMAAGADGFVDKGGDLRSQLHNLFYELFRSQRERLKLICNPHAPPSASFGQADRANPAGAT